MTLATGWAMYCASSKHIPQTERVVIEKETIVENPDYLTHGEARSLFGELQGRVAALEEGQQAHKKYSMHRRWLLSVAINENANLNTRVDQRHHPSYRPNYMKFYGTGINKLPETMKLSDEMRRELQKEVR
jgi:hypothetical protein